MSTPIERRVQEALGQLERALDEGGADTDSTLPPLPLQPPPITAPAGGGGGASAGAFGGARGCSVFSFGTGSPFGGGGGGGGGVLSAAARLSGGSGALGARAAAAALASPGAAAASACRPWSREDLCARIGTFSARTWFGKPPGVGAIACASRGWRNAEYDWLRCASCAARLRAPRAVADWSERATAAFAAQLDGAHDALCPWRGVCCEPATLALVLPAADAPPPGDGDGRSADGYGGYVLATGRQRALGQLRSRYAALLERRVLDAEGAPAGYAVPAIAPDFLRTELPAAAALAGVRAAARAEGGGAAEGGAEAAGGAAEAAGRALLSALASAAGLPDAAAFAAAPRDAEGRAREAALCLALLGWSWAGVQPAGAAPAGAQSAAAAAEGGRGAAAGVGSAPPPHSAQQQRQTGSRYDAGVLVCAESARRVGAWAYARADAPPGAPTTAAAAAAASPAGGGGGALSPALQVLLAQGGTVGAKRRREEGGGAGSAPKALHPVQAHAPDSPWVARLPVAHVAQGAGGAGGGAGRAGAWAVAAALLAGSGAGGAAPTSPLSPPGAHARPAQPAAAAAAGSPGHGGGAGAFSSTVRSLFDAAVRGQWRGGPA